MFGSLWKISCQDSLTDYSAPCSHITGTQRLMAQVYDAHKMTGDFQEQCKLFVASSNNPALLLVKDAAACFFILMRAEVQVLFVQKCTVRTMEQTATGAPSSGVDTIMQDAQSLYSMYNYSISCVVSRDSDSVQQSGERNTRLTSCNWRCSPVVHTHLLHSISSRASFPFFSCPNI